MLRNLVTTCRRDSASFEMSSVPFEHPLLVFFRCIEPLRYTTIYEDHLKRLLHSFFGKGCNSRLPSRGHMKIYSPVQCVIDLNDLELMVAKESNKIDDPTEPSFALSTSYTFQCTLSMRYDRGRRSGRSFNKAM